MATCRSFGINYSGERTWPTLLPTNGDYNDSGQYYGTTLVADVAEEYFQFILGVSLGAHPTTTATLYGYFEVDYVFDLYVPRTSNYNYMTPIFPVIPTIPSTSTTSTSTTTSSALELKTIVRPGRIDVSERTRKTRKGEDVKKLSPKVSTEREYVPSDYFDISLLKTTLDKLDKFLGEPRSKSRERSDRKDSDKPVE